MNLYTEKFNKKNCLVFKYMNIFISPQLIFTYYNLNFFVYIYSKIPMKFWQCQIGKDCVMPGLYAMVGAAAVLGGVT